MDEAIEALLDSGQRLRVATAWLQRFLAGQVQTRSWHGDPDTFILEPTPVSAFPCAAPIPVS